MIKRELVNKKVDDIDFKIMEFTWKESLTLEKRTLEIISPALDLFGSLKNNLKEGGNLLDLEVNDLGAVFQKVLLSLNEPFDYIKSMIVNTYWSKRNKSGIIDVQLDNDEIINEVFHGKTLTAIKLCIEVMKVNKFAFIEGLGGSGILTSTLKNMQEELKSEEIKLENSES